MRKIKEQKLINQLNVQMFESIDFHLSIGVKDNKILFHLDVALGY